MMFGRHKHASETGETLVEVSFALAILSMVLLATFNIVGAGFRVNEEAKQRTQVANLLQEQAEALRNYRDVQKPPTGSWAAFKAGVGTTPFYMENSGGIWSPIHAGLPYVPDLNGQATIYKISITPSTVPSSPPNEHYRFNITASWTAPGGSTETSNIITDLVRLDDFAPKDCSGGCP